jgi:peroxiredoxin
VRNFGQALHLTFDILQDRSTAIQQAYQTTGVPESFLLDRDGIIVKRVIGAHDWSSPVNRALIERLLNEGKAES